MKITHISKLFCLLTALLLLNGNSFAQTGTWTQLANPAPDFNQGVMLLLTDGTVMCFNSSGSGYGTGWDKLTPDASGSYINGTWSTLSFMNYDRLYFSSQVLPNGQVYVDGGEYSDLSPAGGEVYDPVTNVWTLCDTMPSGWNVADGNSEILPNGTVLQGAVYGDSIGYNNLYYTPTTNAYTIAPSSLYSHDESAWLKLPDNSILFVGFGTTNSNRYIPSLNEWVNDATVPVQLYDAVGESGPAFLLPNGKAIFFGASGHNAIYTPSGNNNPGTWTAAADFPTINGSPTGQPDAPGAMMVNGKIICAVGPLGSDGFFDEFRSPIYFVEYDYTKNSFTQVTGTIPGIGADSVAGVSPYSSNMLDLPDGNVLFTFAGSNNYWVYTPGSAALAAGKPTIDNIVPYVCPSYKLTGKLFNGITEGACYGDDWQMETNYPIVRLTNGANVFYAKTTLWNRIGAVQTGNLEDTVIFTPPASLPAGTYSLVVVANGNASAPVSFDAPGALITPADSNFICPGGSINLTASEATSYIWSPSTGLSATSGTTVTASPTITTTYTVTGTNSYGCSATNSVIVTVNSNPIISISPNPASFCVGGNITLRASGGATYAWSPSTGLNATTGATVTANPTTAVTYTVTGTTIFGCSSKDSVAVTINPKPVISASPNPASYCSGQSSMLTASGGNTYTWSPSNGLSATSGATVNANPTASVTYTVTGTSKVGCSASDTVSVKVFANPIITISPSSAAYCPGGSAAINASGGISYTWSPSTSLSASTGDSVIANPATTTTYTITGTNSNTCSATKTIIVTVNSNPIITVSASPDTVCNADTTRLSASGGDTYTWSPATGLSATTGTPIKANPGITTTYYVTGTNSNECSSTDTIVLHVQKCSGIDHVFETNHQLSVYPNPAANQLTISSNQLSINKIEIVNVLGQTLIEQNSINGWQKQTIDISKLTGGIYFYLVTSSDLQIATGKIVKE